MQNHKKWLIKGQNDLKAAKVLYDADCLDISIYHAQQCSEKVLKGYLAYQKQPIVKTHDLVALIFLCQQFDSKFSEMAPLAEKLTPFSSVFRYPDVEMYPKKRLVLSSIDDAEKILCFVKERIK